MEIANARVVVAEVATLSADLRPAYVSASGVAKGAYLRAGDGDRRMTDAEIALTYSARTQPVYDREGVTGASVDDLNRRAVSRTLERVRLGAPKLRDVADDVAMHRLGVLDRPGGRPTLAGILAYGEFPQQFFPQLMVTFVARPYDGSEGARFLDSRRCTPCTWTARCRARC